MSNPPTSLEVLLQVVVSLYYLPGWKPRLFALVGGVTRIKKPARRYRPAETCAARVYDTNKEALDKAKASTAAAPGLIPLHRGSISKESVVQID